MAAKKFERGSELYMMMNDLLRLFQETWETEDGEYWQALIDKINHFVEVYKVVDDVFVREIMLSYIDIQEEKYRIKKGLKNDEKQAEV